MQVFIWWFCEAGGERNTSRASTVRLDESDRPFNEI